MICIKRNALNKISTGASDCCKSQQCWATLSEQEKKWATPKYWSKSVTEEFIESPSIVDRVIIYDDLQCEAFAECAKDDDRYVIGTVCARYHGIGYGLCSLVVLLQALKEKGIKTVYAEVTNDNVPTLALMEKVGFTKDGESNDKSMFKMDLSSFNKDVTYNCRTKRYTLD